MWYSVACFGVKVHLMFVHYAFSSVWVAEWSPFGKSFPFGWPFVLIVFCLFVFSHFGFKSGICLLIAPVPVQCFSITFINVVHKHS